MKTKAEQPDSLRLSATHWQKMKDVIIMGDGFLKTTLGEGFEFRFIEMPDSTYSALLSFNHQDVFHFMWQEVSGLVNISHRIVHADFRGQGIATEVLYAIEQRVQRMSNEQKSRYSLIIETTQLSVVRLGLKRGMQVSRGKQVYTSLKEHQLTYRLDENTHVSDENGYRIPFRVSKAFQPQFDHIVSTADTARTRILEVLHSKTA